MNRFSYIILLAIASASAQAAPPAAKPKAAPSISARVAAVVANYHRRTGAKVGVHVVRLSDGKSLYAFEQARPLIPASNQKIVSSAVALKRLGEDFRFRTVLAVEGDDLVVLGDGDPTTGDARLAARRGGGIYDEMDRWAAALKAAGVTRIKGDLIVRAGIFAPPMTHPEWSRRDLTKWYGAGVAGVNFNDNCIDVGFTVAGGGVQARVSPVSRWITVVNRVKVGKPHLWDCRFSRGGTTVTLTGKATRSSTDTISVAVPDPPMLFAAVLADRLDRAGVKWAGRVRVSVQPSSKKAIAARRVIAVTATPLADAMGRANKQSLNFMAECLLLRASVVPGAPATWARAAKVATKTLTDDYGIAAAQFRISDGSGLSRANAISPAALTSLLASLSRSGTFVGSLAVAGTDGLMARRLKGVARGRVLAKTGSIRGVSGLSGYVVDRRGKPAIAFSILTNVTTYARWSSAKPMENAICRLLVEHLDAPPESRAKLLAP